MQNNFNLDFDISIPVFQTGFQEIEKAVNSKDYSKNNINPLICGVTCKSGIYQTIFQLDIN